MPKHTTHVLKVIDQSGSMMGLTTAVCSGFNSYLEELAADKTDDNRYRITAALFSTASDYQLLCTDEKLKNVPRLSDANYTPSGMTALYDAIGRTIVAFEQANPVLDPNDKVLFVVHTDGGENCSQDYTQQAVNKMIEERQDRWTFLFVGAGRDTWRQAAGLGFTPEGTYSVDATPEGMNSSYTGIGHATRSTSRGLDASKAASKHMANPE